MKNREKVTLMICEDVLLVQLFFFCVFVQCPFLNFDESLCFCVSLWKNENNKKIGVLVIGAKIIFGVLKLSCQSGKK